MKYKPEVEGRGGWSTWIAPEKKYRLMCCDCGLVHDMQFAHGLNSVSKREQIIFRVRRNARATAAVRRWKPKKLKDALK
jgi:hypothetical protein